MEKAVEKDTELSPAGAAPDRVQDVAAALVWLRDDGRKCSRTALYRAVSSGRCRRQPDGSFMVRDLKKYAASLDPLGGATPQFVDDVEDLAIRKAKADIRKAEAVAKREEYRLAVEQGRYVSRDLLAEELAVRAVALRDAVRRVSETSLQDAIDAVHGDPRCAPALLELLSAAFDSCFDDYCRPLDIAVTFDGLSSSSDEDHGGAEE